MTTRISGVLLGMFTGIVFCMPSYADNTGKVHNFIIAPEISDYEYKEPGVMKVSGTMYGFTFQYLNNGGVGRIKESMPVQLRARFNYMYNDDLDYDGGFFDPITGTEGPFKRGGVTQQFVDMAFAGGFESKLGQNFSVSPYAGLGYRYLKDDNDGVVTIDYGGVTYDIHDYKREQTYYYLPIGADWKMPLSSGWKFAANTELDILLRGENTSHVNGKLKFRQKSGHGLRFSVKFEKDFMTVGSVFAEPFFRYWNISRSNTQSGYYEPKNRTEEFGLRVGFSF
ncbi:MAG: hypothetical protein LBE22_01885 [Azoarcus sp.]|nr:hypothetical protein [Azoarcus sp.]